MKKYKMTCSAKCKDGWSVKSTHELYAVNKRKARKKMLKEIKASYCEYKSCKIKRKTIRVKEIVEIRKEI